MQLLEKTRPLINESLSHSTVQTALPDIQIYHTAESVGDVIQIQKSGFSVVLQGEKEVQIGDQSFHYKVGDFACYAVDLPIITHYHATPDKPYIDLRLFMPPEMLRSMTTQMLELNHSFPPLPERKVISRMCLALEQSLCRLLDLLKNPQEIPLLQPLVMQEIIYRLLISEQGGLLHKIAMQNSNTQRIAATVEWLKNHFNQPLKIEMLAEQTGMSSSGFFAHFRKLTGISPLQYQKNLRLAEAHRQLKRGEQSISEIAYAVGYDSLPQFSREYKRTFGRTAREDYAK